MAQAYLVRARAQGPNQPLEMLYAAMAETVEDAKVLVAKLVAEGTELSATGECLRPEVARAIRLTPGQAKLI